MLKVLEVTPADMQLTQKDLPVLEQILPVKFQFTMLKGRANYLCTRRLRKAIQQAESLFNSPERAELEQIRSGDQRAAAAGLSLGQRLAGNACVAFSMIAELDRAARAHGGRSGSRWSVGRTNCPGGGQK